MSAHRVTISGKLTDGKLDVDRADLASRLTELPAGPIKVSIYTPCSDQARAYYFATIVPMVADYQGQTEDEAHADLKLAHNGGRSTTELDAGEFTAYLARVIQWCAQWCGLIIPDPHG
jgi:hypothetical protein